MTPRIDLFKAAPDAIKAMMGLETYVRASGLEPSLMELIKMRASQMNGCAFCLDMHARDARKHGETEQRLYLLSAWRDSPLYSDRERAAFLLHDVFGASFDEVATALGRTPATCRQLAARARRNVRSKRPRFPVPPEEGERIARAFRAAADSGDASALSGLLAQSVVLTADGGGRASAVRAPLVGRNAVARFFSRLARIAGGPGIVREARINGLPGFVTRSADGALQTTAFEIEDGLIAAIHVVRNPDKLAHVAPP